jgi:hypothetical protein
MRKIIAAIVTGLAMLGGVAATAATASVASGAAASHSTRETPATVLVNDPASSVCIGRAFTVGVWYQAFSGGSRAYRVVVDSPSGARIFDRHGLASSAQWAFWTIRTSQAGEYRTVYSGSWTFRATTQARHCQ